MALFKRKKELKKEGVSPVVFHMGASQLLRVLYVGGRYKGNKIPYNYVIERFINGEWIHTASRNHPDEAVNVYNTIISGLVQLVKKEDLENDSISRT